MIDLLELTWDLCGGKGRLCGGRTWKLLRAAGH